MKKTIRVDEEIFKELRRAKSIAEFERGDKVTWDEFFRIMLDAFPHVKVKYEVESKE